MALKKSKTIPNGATGEYWKITQIEVNKSNLSANFTLTLFFNKTYSDNGSPSIGCNYTFSGFFTKEQLNEDLFELGYTTIKAKIAEPKPSKQIGLLRNSAWDDLNSAVDI